jgi:dTDP-D-glucose 4,6-dehydratase
LARYLLIVLGLLSPSKSVANSLETIRATLVDGNQHIDFKKLHIEELKGSFLSHALPKESSYIEFVEDRPFNDQSYVISDEKIKSLGWYPKVSFEHGILQTIAWYQTTDISTYFRK